MEGHTGRVETERGGRAQDVDGLVGEQPYLRDSDQSEPSPDVTIRHSTAAPGAAAATFWVSSSESTTNSRTPSRAANAMSCAPLDRVGVDEVAGRRPRSSAATTSAGLATSKLASGGGQGGSRAGSGFALTA